MRKAPSASSGGGSTGESIPRLASFQVTSTTAAVRR